MPFFFVGFKYTLKRACDENNLQFSASARGGKSGQVTYEFTARQRIANTTVENIVVLIGWGGAGDWSVFTQNFSLFQIQFMWHIHDEGRIESILAVIGNKNFEHQQIVGAQEVGIDGTADTQRKNNVQFDLCG